MGHNTFMETSEITLNNLPVNWATDCGMYVKVMSLVKDAVRCPRCKAEAGQPCDWGTTSTSYKVHTPRARKAGL